MNRAQLSCGVTLSHCHTTSEGRISLNIDFKRQFFYKLEAKMKSFTTQNVSETNL